MPLGLGLGTLLGAGVSAIGGLVGSSVNRNANLAAIREQNRGNMELAKYKYDRDIEMWNMQNEYNTPSAQMSRFAQAGLNPNFMYGQGSAGNAASAPQMETPTLNAYSQQDFGIGAAVSGGVDTYLRFLQFEQSQKVQESVIAKNNVEAAGQELRNANQIVKNASDAFNFGILSNYGKSQAEAALQQTYANIRNIQSSTSLNWDRSAVEKAREDLIIQQTDHELEKIGLTRLQKAKVLTDIAYIHQHTEVLKKQASILQYQLDTNPSVATQSKLNEINAAIALANGEWNNSDWRVGYNNIIEILNKATGVIGSALNGYKTLRTSP